MWCVKLKINVLKKLSKSHQSKIKALGAVGMLKLILNLDCLSLKQLWLNVGESLFRH